MQACKYGVERDREPERVRGDRLRPPQPTFVSRELYFKEGLWGTAGEIGTVNLHPDSSPVPQQEQGRAHRIKRARQMNAQYPQNTQKA